MTTQVQETYLLRIDVNANTTTNYLTYYSCIIRNESGEKLVKTGGHREPQQAVKTELKELVQTIHLGSM